MKRKHKLSIVLPMHNEEDNIPILIPMLNKYLKESCEDYEIIMAENGSNDKTLELAKKYSKENPKIKYIHLDKGNYGKALREGFSKAKMDVVMYMDSDLPYDIKYIGEGLNFIDEYDAVIGYPNYSIRTFKRNIFSKVYNAFVFVLFGIKVNHVNFAFKMFRKELYDKMKLSADNWIIDVDLVFNMIRNKAKIKQLYIIYNERQSGVSSIKTSTAFYMFLGLIKYFFKNRFRI